MDRPEDLVVAESDSAAARMVKNGAMSVGLADGDLLRTLGGLRPPDATSHAFPVDCGWARLDGGPRRPFVAHLVARRRWWQGHWAVVMNAAWWGPLYLGPRAHPNDGLLDITHGALGPRERLEARRRAKSGTHLPHPDLAVVRRSAWRHRFPRPTEVYLDGVREAVGESIEVEVEPDAFTVIL